MSLVHRLGRVSGSASNSLRLPITVWDSGGATVDVGEAADYALEIAPNAIMSLLPTANPTIERVAGHIVRVEVEYTPPNVEPPSRPPTPETGQLTRGANFLAKGKHVTTPIEPIAVYKRGQGDVTDQYAHTKWSVNSQGKGFEQLRNLGLDVDPLPETFWHNYYAPNTFVTKSYLDLVGELCSKGAFNNATWNGYPQGSLQLVRFSAIERTPDDWELSYGWGYKPPEFNVQRGDIVVPEMRGSWISWKREVEEYDVDSGILELVVDLVVVQRVWPEEDFDLLQLPTLN